MLGLLDVLLGVNGMIDGLCNMSIEFVFKIVRRDLLIMPTKCEHLDEFGLFLIDEKQSTVIRVKIIISLG